MLYEIFQLLSSNPGAGGLFDFGATLPLMAIQFLLLMFILDTVLYSPLLNTINEREEYIQNNLKKAAQLIEKSNQIKMLAEKEIATAEQTSQINIAKYTKACKESNERELEEIQTNLNTLIEKGMKIINIDQRVKLNTLRVENEDVLTRKILNLILN